MNLDEIKEILREKYVISKSIVPRCYLFPDGDILQLDIHKTHIGVNNFLIDKGIIEDEYSSGNCNYLENLGCIRINLETEGFIGLSHVCPTEEQYRVLKDIIIMYCNKNYAQNRWFFGRSYIYPEFQIFTPKSRGFEYKIYNLDKYQDNLEYFIDIIKKYYSTGKLLEEINLKDIQ